MEILPPVIYGNGDDLMILYVAQYLNSSIYPSQIIKSFLSAIPISGVTPRNNPLSFLISEQLSSYFTLGISRISTTIEMLEGWEIFQVKEGIQSSVWSTKTFLCVIKKSGYKQIKKDVRYQK